MWQRDDTKYSRRSTLPPVPEEEDENAGSLPLPFFVFPNTFGTAIESTMTYLGVTGSPERRSSLFSKMGSDTSCQSTVNRRSWHGESNPTNSEIQYLSARGYESDDEDSFTQAEKRMSVPPAERGSSIFKWFCIYFLIATIVFGLCYFCYSRVYEEISNCKPCKCDCDDMRKLYRLFTLTNDNVFQCTFEEMKVNYTHSVNEH